MKSLPVILSGILIIVFHYYGQCQKTYTLRECISIAQDNSLDIQRALLSQDDADINKKLAFHQMFPSLNAGSSFGYNIGRRIDPTTNSYLNQTFLSQGMNLNTRMILYNGNRVRNNIKKSRIESKAVSYDIQQIKKDIALLVTNTYLSILFSKENVKNAKSQYDSTNERLEKMNKMINVGAAAKSSSLSMEAQLLRDEQKLMSAKNTLDMNILNLKYLMFLTDEDSLSIDVPDIEVNIDEKYSTYKLKELYDIASQTYPALKASKLRVEVAKFNEKIARASYLPSIGIGGGISTNYSNKAKIVEGYEQQTFYQPLIIDNETKNVGFISQRPILADQKYLDQIKNNWGVFISLQLSVPIYNNYEVKAQVQKAKLAYKSTDIAEKKLVQDLKINISKSLSELKNAQNEYFAAQKTYQAQLNAFENAKKQYDLGVIGSYEYLNEKSLYEQSQNSLLISKYQYVFKSKILDFYLGKEITL